MREEILEEARTSKGVGVSEPNPTLGPLPPQIPSLTPQLQVQSNRPGAGNLSRYFSNWSKITKNEMILNIIKFGYKLQLTSSNFKISNSNSNPSKLKLPQIIGEVDRLLQLGVISEVKFSQSQTVSRIFSVPKPNGDIRLIIDLSKLNNYIIKTSFRMEDKSTIRSLICKGDYMFSIDLKDAFHSVSLHPESKKFVTFELLSKRYCYNTLPFGLSSAPRIFSKILKPAISFLRLSGMRITFYLDDILVISSTYLEACSSVKTCINLLNDLGFTINYEKSSLTPMQNILHLGYNWNSVNMSISLPEEKLIKIKNLASNCLKGPCSLRKLAMLLGLLVSSCNGFLYAPLHFRGFQLNFITALRVKNDWDSLWTLDSEAVSDLNWWCSANLGDLVPVPILKSEPDLSLFTDASLTGWGAYLSTGEFVSGSWNKVDSNEHINFLELKTVLLALRTFRDALYKKSILVRSDNSTSVFYINKMGGTHSKKLCLLSLEIWNILLQNSITCRASHISGIDNTVADYLSRNLNCHEYYLCPDAFKQILHLIPFILELDIFASSKNTKLDRYVSLFEDPFAYAIDCFSFRWPSHIYAFPPIPLVLKSINKIKQDQVEFCLFVTPAWNTSTFLPLLIDMLISNPIFIHKNYLLGYVPTRHQFHLMAWPISSHFVKREEFKKKSQMSCLNPSVHLLLDLMPGSGRDLCNGLIAEKIPPLFLPF